MKRRPSVIETQFTKGQKTKLKILEDSISCFVANGFEGSSISELSRAAHLNRALINHYFGSKENLIQEAIQLMGATGKTSTDFYMKVRSDIRDPIARYIQATFNWLKDHPSHGRFLVLSIHRSSYDTKTRHAISAIFESAWKRLETDLQIERNAGHHSLVDPAATAKQVHSLLLGTLVSWMSHENSKIEDEEKRCIEGAMRLVGSNVLRDSTP